MAPATTPETELNRLRRLEENKTCINCDNYAKYGHNHVCEKFHIFVCNNCKSALGCYSFRVKSITMSNWTKEQVEELEERNGGGNAIAKRLWYATWTPEKLKKPNEKDHITVYHEFIKVVFVEERFKNKNIEQMKQKEEKKVEVKNSNTRTTTNDLLDVSSPPSSKSNFPPPAAPVTATAHAQHFDPFNISGTDSLQQPKQTHSHHHHPHIITSAGNDVDEFGDFASATPTPGPVPQSTTKMDDDFGDFVSSTVATPSASITSCKSDSGLFCSNSIPVLSPSSTTQFSSSQQMPTQKTDPFESVDFSNDLSNNNFRMSASNIQLNTFNYSSSAMKGNISDLLSPEVLGSGNFMSTETLASSTSSAQVGTTFPVKPPSTGMQFKSSVKMNPSKDAFADLLKGHL